MILFLFILFSSYSHAIELSFEQDQSLPLVYINVAVKSGSVSDPHDQLGITNFMGEMLLRGTTSRTKEQIDLELDQMGATLGVEIRAEALILRGAVISTELDHFLKLLAELITRSNFPEHEIRKLKAEVISAILESLGNDSSLASRHFTKFLFRDHPYGKPILGTIKSIEKLTRIQIIRHYEHLLRDVRLLVIGSGDAPHEKIQAWAKSLAITRPGGKPAHLINMPINPAMRRVQIVDKPDRTQTQIYGGQMGIRMTDKQFFPLYLANHAFGGGSFSARMMLEIRVKRGWSYGANSFFRHGLRPRSWQFHLFPASKDAAQALELSLKMLEDLRQNGITQNEFDFAKNSLMNNADFMYNTPQKRVENKLLERTLNLPDGFMKSYSTELQKLSWSEVNTAIKTFFRPDQLSITVLGTAKDLKSAVAKAAQVSEDTIEITPYTEE